MIRRIGGTLVVIILFASCWGEDYSPKPRGYFNIEFPKKQYRQFDQGCAFTFDYPVYGSVEADSRDTRPCWYNLVFSRFNGRLHLTYYDVTSKAEFESLAEDARTFAFKHTVKANAIDQKLINYPDKRVYGIYYAIEGNTASSIQFFLTDSAKHYFRGALYFSERPQFDSIQPVVEFIRVDVDRLIGTFKWK
ncbi:gliding motility lipoprotein GldD [Pedobacter deserti]|uniref:gliding motility lipoprotein GldD n=1 Tax=Pedobacter deserti TaxID=2817382 RepID=UPI0021093104|nr:gliding motility lipoprotein GldD [Pedobacter sp. SYSU D00382]